MTASARALSDLLARERAAALRADVEELEELQREKRELFQAVERDGGLESPAFARLAETARANVALIRQLVGIYRALAGLPPAGYGADGREAVGVGPRLRRGVL